MTTTDTQAHARVPFRTRTTILALGVPLAIVATVVALSFSWRDDLPDPIAIHWGLDGPDGFGSLTPNVLIPAAVCLAVAGLLWALGFYAGRQSFTRRGAAAGAVWMVTLLEGVSLGGLVAQKGVEDARDAGPIVGPMVVTFIVSGIAAGAAILLSPGDPPRPTTAAVPSDAVRLPLGQDEEASWIREVVSPGYRYALPATVIGVALIVLLTEGWAIGLLVGIALGFSFVAFMHFVVTVNRDGLTVRSVIGRPRFRIPLDEVIRAEVVSVRPIREFGGFGIRGDGHGRVGVVIRTGEMLQVNRTGDRIFVVTVDDSATAAALLNTLAERARR